MKPHHSPIKVYPTSWDKRNLRNLKKDWEIRYTYFSDEFPNGKIISLSFLHSYAQVAIGKTSITNISIS